jgi:Immunoglobulin I-set domain
MWRELRFGLLCALAVTVAACGGGGGSGSGTPPPSATAPAITSQPASLTVKAGQAANFTVVASGTAPLTYQWQKDGAAVAGATASTYTTAPTTVADDGAQYTVVVSNAAGSMTSDAARLSVTPVPSAASVYDVVTFKSDTSRTGQFVSETTLTPANVNSSGFGLLGLMPVDGKVDAQPLYLGNLPVAGASHNVLYVATENDSLYAFDADTRAVLWKVALLASGETPTGSFGCDTIFPVLGISSTPVIDRSAGANGTLYAISYSIDQSSNYHQRLHALDVTTGAELLNGPVEITGSFTRAGVTTTFDPSDYDERAALLLANGTIYTTWSSHCDIPPYGGWVMAYDQSTLAQIAALNVGPGSAGNTSSSVGPGIWMSGSGPAVDAAGNIYLLTANGPFETTLNGSGFPSGGDFGNSFLKLTLSDGQLSVADYFTMSNVLTETAGDQDLGSGGELVLPDVTDSTGTVRHLVIGAGKDGVLYVVNRDNMGRYSPIMNSVWQELDGALGFGVWASPAFFNQTLYYGQKGGQLKAFSVTNARVVVTPTSLSATSFGYPGTSPVVSANGTGNAVLWAHESSTPAVLHAYDATNLGNELYNSNQATGARDQFGAGNTFIVPVVANGKVFVGTLSAVAEFGLLPLGANATPQAKPARRQALH